MKTSMHSKVVLGSGSNMTSLVRFIAQMMYFPFGTSIMVKLYESMLLSTVKLSMTGLSRMESGCALSL